MPGPQKTKGTLRNTRFKSKMKRQNISRKRKHAFYLQELDEEQKKKYFKVIAEIGLSIARRLEKEGKVTPLESCDGSFDTYYNNEDSLKITNELFKLITRSQEAHNAVIKEFRQVKRNEPGMKFTLKVLLLFLVTSLIQTTDAKWNELSSPPEELSAYDTSSAALIGLGIGEIGLGFIFPPLAVLGTHTITCGLVARGVGSAQRLYDHSTGVHPLSRGDVITESMGVILPGTSEIMREVYHFHSSMTSAVDPDILPPYSFKRNNPVLGQNISSSLSEIVRPSVNTAIMIKEKITGRPVSESNRNEFIQSVSKAGQQAIEQAINSSAWAGLAAMEFAKTHKNTMTKFSKGPTPIGGPPVPPIPVPV